MVLTVLRTLTESKQAVDAEPCVGADCAVGSLVVGPAAEPEVGRHGAGVGAHVEEHDEDGDWQTDVASVRQKHSELHLQMYRRSEHNNRNK